jgi:hypothetical protein
MFVRFVGAPGARTDMAGEKTCVFDVAATVIASGAVPGDPTVPIPNWSRSLPGGDNRHDARECDVVDDVDHRVVRRLCLGAAAEKLITSMPSRTADSKAAAISGVLAIWPIGVGTLKTR